MGPKEAASFHRVGCLAPDLSTYISVLLEYLFVCFSQDLSLEILFPPVRLIHQFRSVTMQLWQLFTIFMVLFANDALGCVKSPKKKGAPCRPSLEGCYACSTNKRLIVSLVIWTSKLVQRANGLGSSNAATASTSGPRSRIAELQTV